jgi:hypothetical protein
MGPDRKPVLNADGTPKIARSVLPYEPGRPVAPSPAPRRSRRAWRSTRVPRDQADAGGGAGVAADQPSAGLPDLRPGRRVQAAGVLGGARAGRQPALWSRRSTSRRRSISGPGSCSTTSAAFCAPAASGSPRTLSGTTLGIVNRGSYNTIAAWIRETVRQQLHAQHRRSLSGGRADVEGFPVPDAGLVPQGDQERLHQLRHRAATSPSVAGRSGLPVRHRATMTR